MREQQQNKRLLLSVILISAAGCLIYAISGAVRTNYGIMRGAISGATGVSYGDMSLILAFTQLFYGLLQPVFGVLALKKSNTFVLCIGALLMITGLIFTPVSNSFIMVLFFLGIILPIGTAALCFGMVMGAISPALPPKYAATVSGFLSAANGIASSVMAPVIQRLIAAQGIRTTMWVLCVPTAMVIPLAVWLARKSVSQVVNPKDIIHENISIRTLFSEGIQNREYRHVALAFFTCGFHMTLIETHLYTQITEYGFAEDIAAYGFTLYGIFAIIGSIVVGALCSRFRNKTVLGCLYGSRPVMTILFLLLPKSIFSIYAFMILLGFTGNSTVPPTSGIIRREFSPAKFATLYGLCMVTHQIGGFLSSWTGGLLVEATGSYTTIWLICAALSAGASTLAFTVHEE